MRILVNDLKNKYILKILPPNHYAPSNTSQLFTKGMRCCCLWASADLSTLRAHRFRTVMPTEAFCRKGTSLHKPRPKSVSSKGQCSARSCRSKEHNNCHREEWRISTYSQQVHVISRCTWCSGWIPGVLGATKAKWDSLHSTWTLSNGAGSVW